MDSERYPEPIGDEIPIMRMDLEGKQTEVK